MPYEYFATVLKVVDGDTCVLDVQLGFDVNHKAKFRLFGINTPESFGKEASAAGHAAKARLCELLPDGCKVFVRSHKDKADKYGRLLAEVYLLAVDGSPLVVGSVNQLLVDEGHAKPYFGKGEKPV